MVLVFYVGNKVYTNTVYINKSKTAKTATRNEIQKKIIKLKRSELILHILVYE